MANTLRGPQGGEGSGRLRAYLRYARMSVAMALAEARHHTAPRGQKTARAEATYDALWSQRSSGGLDAPVPQMGNELLDVFKLLDTVLPEQVIDVPQISQDSIQQRLVDPGSASPPQPEEQLVEVPTILYFSSSGFPSRSSTIQFPRGRGRRLQGFSRRNRVPIHGGGPQGLRPGQGSQRTVEQIAAFLVVAHLPLLTLQLGVDDVDDSFQGVFSHSFPTQKKCEGSPARSLPESVVDTSSWTPAAYERSELVDDNGHVWVRLDTVHASFWKNLDTQHSQWERS